LPSLLHLCLFLVNSLLNINTSQGMPNRPFILKQTLVNLVTELALSQVKYYIWTLRLLRINTQQMLQVVSRALKLHHLRQLIRVVSHSIRI